MFSRLSALALYNTFCFVYVGEVALHDLGSHSQPSLATGVVTAEAWEAWRA